MSRNLLQKLAPSILFPIIVLGLAFALTGALTAEEENKEEDIYLATITTDYVSKSYDLLISLNDKGLITSIKTKNNEKNKVKDYPVSVLDQPITLVKAVGITLVSLKCENFATNRGCDINIEYPSNITLGKFKNFKAKLQKLEDKWSLTHSGRPFTKLHLVAKKVMGLLIGIKRIETT